MSTAHLQQTIAVTRGVLANVSADQMQNATPCDSWDVAGVINHVVSSQNFFVAGMKGQPPTGGDTNWAEGDFVAAFDEAAAATVACFEEDGVLQQMIAMPFGKMPGAAVMGLAITDTFTHGWDIAKATGQSTDLAPELAAGILAQARQMIQPGFRAEEDGAGPFLAEQQPVDGSCNADQLAAFLGRTV